MEVKVIKGNNPNVKKFVFEKEDAIYEAVVYKYPTYQERTVICCSVQSGCPVGCTFCGTGKRFVRNLTSQEIVDQITYVLIEEDLIHDPLPRNEDDYEEEDLFPRTYLWQDSIQRFQIMFMSMGEPMLNWENVEDAIYHLDKICQDDTELLISTVGIKDDMALNSLGGILHHLEGAGLQFSIHNSLDIERSDLIPFHNKMSLREIRDVGIALYKSCGKEIFLNYCVTEDNCSMEHINRLMDLFSPTIFNITLSAICNIEENNKEDKTYWIGLNGMSQILTNNGYDVRVFDPAGKDDIGGGCGQLWFVQEWLKNHGS